MSRQHLRLLSSQAHLVNRSSSYAEAESSISSMLSKNYFWNAIVNQLPTSHQLAAGTDPFRKKKVSKRGSGAGATLVFEEKKLISCAIVVALPCSSISWSPDVSGESKLIISLSCAEQLFRVQVFLIYRLEFSVFVCILEVLSGW